MMKRVSFASIKRLIIEVVSVITLLIAAAKAVALELHGLFH
jgi:hypothetical protein